MPKLPYSSIDYNELISENISKLRNPFFELRSQKIFALKTLVFLKFFWKTVFKIKGFYKIEANDNIDLRFR